MQTLIWRGNCNVNKGFGNVSANLIKQLRQFGFRVIVDEYPNPKHKLTEHLIPDIPYINCVNDMTISPDCNYPQILYTGCEGTRAEAKILELEPQLSSIWVPSSHSKKAIENIGFEKPVLVVPHGIDFENFDPKTVYVPKSSKFRFLSIFRWTWRKAPELLLKAFSEEFDQSEAELYIKTSDKKHHFLDLPANLPSNIHLIVNEFDIQELIQLYASAHAFVLPTRGEGWGLPYTEAAAMGLPVIATAWGGQMDFLSHNLAYLVEVTELVEAPPDAAKEPGNLFAEPSLDDLRRKMRMVFEKYEVANLNAESLRQKLGQNFTWKHAAEILINNLFGN